MFLLNMKKVKSTAQNFFTLAKGDILGIFGKSGVGKSTLVKILMGIIKPTSGQVEIDAINLQEYKHIP